MAQGLHGAPKFVFFFFLEGKIYIVTFGEEIATCKGRFKNPKGVGYVKMILQNLIEEGEVSRILLSQKFKKNHYYFFCVCKKS